MSDDDWIVVFDGQPSDAALIAEILTAEGIDSKGADTYASSRFGYQIDGTKGVVLVRAPDVPRARTLIDQTPHLGNDLDPTTHGLTIHERVRRQQEAARDPTLGLDP